MEDRKSFGDDANSEGSLPGRDILGWPLSQVCRFLMPELHLSLNARGNREAASNVAALVRSATAIPLRFELLSGGNAGGCGLQHAYALAAARPEGESWRLRIR